MITHRRRRRVGLSPRSMADSICSCWAISVSTGRGQRHREIPDAVHLGLQVFQQAPGAFAVDAERDGLMKDFVFA